MTDDPEIAASVIIPAIALDDNFVAMLHRLAAQDCGFRFEIVVVLNHAERPVGISLPPECRLLFCARPGSYAARNVGIEAARGSLLAFTDSDAEPQDGWLKEGYAAAEMFAFNMLIAGRVQFYRRRPTAAGAYDALFYLGRNWFGTRGVGATVNLFVPAHIARKLRGFEPELHSAGDTDFCRRAKAAGHGLAFAEQAEVRHPARDRLVDLIQKERRNAGGFVSADRLRGRAFSVRRHLRDEWQTFYIRQKGIEAIDHPDAPKRRMKAINLAVLTARFGERVLVALGKPPRRL